MRLINPTSGGDGFNLRITSGYYRGYNARFGARSVAVRGSAPMAQNGESFRRSSPALLSVRRRMAKADPEAREPGMDERGLFVHTPGTSEIGAPLPISDPYSAGRRVCVSLK